MVFLSFKELNFIVLKILSHNTTQLCKQIHISKDTQLPYILWHSDIDTQISEKVILNKHKIYYLPQLKNAV